jgi:hypothetical protein
LPAKNVKDQLFIHIIKYCIIILIAAFYLIFGLYDEKISKEFFEIK